MIFRRILIKMHPRSAAAVVLAAARDEDCGWFGMLCGAERGRALRDKIAHQIEFPIEYAELHPPSEKESAVVGLGEVNIFRCRSFCDVLLVALSICSVNSSK
jgi:hypothetical protein